MIKKIPFHEIEGFYTGHATDVPNATGVTVILAPESAVAGVDVRGGGPATRETNLLDPTCMVQAIHAVVLSGGSAFGLEASSGVMEYCRDHGWGFNLKDITVPIVVQASLFDLSVGNPKAFPDKQMGFEACVNAEQNHPQSGNVGAGTGASVGKWAGFENAMKTGQGLCAFQAGDLKVGAIVAVNACGDVFEPDSKERLAGMYDYKTKTPLNSEDALLSGLAQTPGDRQNTTIACIITNARLNKAEMNKLASMAQNALARTIRPVHTPSDGDTVFAMTTGKVDADLTAVSVLAVKALSEAIADAAKSAEAAYGLASWSSLQND